MALERLRSMLFIAAMALACFSALSAGRGDESGVRKFLGDFVEAQQAADRADLSAFYAQDATHMGPPLVVPDTGLELTRIDFIAENVVLVDGYVDSQPRERVFFVLRNYGGGWAIAASLVEPVRAHS